MDSMGEVYTKITGTQVSKIKLQLLFNTCKRSLCLNVKEKREAQRGQLIPFKSQSLVRLGKGFGAHK